MRLDQALVIRGLCESRAEAQELIADGHVLVNGVLISKQTRETIETDAIEVTARRKFVSRGGEKLEGILLDIFKTEEAIRALCEGNRALDIGSSTGGFTDCLLKMGVAHVDAVDVGTQQLHEKLRNDPRIALYENTDIRQFKNEHTYDIVVADLSFISLKNVFADVMKFGTEGTSYFLLLKPQFEVGQGNTKKGIVKDQHIVDKILSEYKELAREFDMQDVQIVPCRIRGGDGNQEYFLYGRKRGGR